MKDEPNYSPETIRRYRELDRTRGFDHEIVERSPATLTKDRLKLDCGHERQEDYAVLETKEELRKAQGQTGLLKIRCWRCEKEWLQAQERP